MISFTFFFLLFLSSNKCIAADMNCNSDCTCGDWTYDQCHRAHPSNSIHVDDIAQCMQNCDIFAEFGQCNFILFLNTNVDENCLIMVDDLEDYLHGCHVKGQPLYQEGDQSMSFCPDDTATPTDCVSCQDTPCAGYAGLECDFTHQSDSGSEQHSYEECVESCKQEDGATYAYYDGIDVKRCHCFTNAERECKKIVMKPEAKDCGNY